MRMRTGSCRWMRAVVWTATAVALQFLASSVYAAPLYCIGTIQRVLLYADGTVAIVGSWRGDYTYVCNAQGTWGGIADTTCLSWYGALLKARKDATNVTYYYYDGAGFSCANLPTYSSSLVTGYVELRE